MGNPLKIRISGTAGQIPILFVEDCYSRRDASNGTKNVPVGRVFFGRTPRNVCSRMLKHYIANPWKIRISGTAGRIRTLFVGNCLSHRDASNGTKDDPIGSVFLGRRLRDMYSPSRITI